MPTYVAMLGREPELSVAEVVALATRLGLKLTWADLNQRYAVFEVDCEAAELKPLAGLVKLAQVVSTVPSTKEALFALAHDTLTESGYDQWHFGFSWYGQPPRWLTAVGMELKRAAKEGGRRARLVVARGAELSSVVVAKNKLLPPKGCEFVVFPKESEELLVARTLWVQEFEAWGERDYGRPERDAKVGMLPPKLAHMMVNLAQVPTEGKILDPFCGSGTVLQEAAVLGYQNLIGTDSDARGVERTRANFAWLKQHYSNIAEPELAVSDIRKLLSTLQNRQFDAIITEPYLGPPLRGKEQQGELRKVAQELTEFYSAVLKVLAQALRAGGRLVMVWPVVRGRGEEHLLALVTHAHDLGLKVQNLLPDSAPHTWHRKRGSLLYERPDQHVAREIFVFGK